jgi:hypothetical protein
LPVPPPVDAVQRPLALLQVWPPGHPLLRQPATHAPAVQMVEGGEHCVSVVHPPLIAMQWPVLVSQLVPEPHAGPPEPHPATHCPEAQTVAGGEH